MSLKPILILVLIVLLSIGAQCSFSPKMPIGAIDGSNKTFIEDFEKYDTKLTSGSSIILDSRVTPWSFTPWSSHQSNYFDYGILELYNNTALYPINFKPKQTVLTPPFVFASNESASKINASKVTGSKSVPFNESASEINVSKVTEPKSRFNYETIKYIFIFFVVIILIYILYRFYKTTRENERAGEKLVQDLKDMVTPDDVVPDDVVNALKGTTLDHLVRCKRKRRDS